MFLLNKRPELHASQVLIRNQRHFHHIYQIIHHQVDCKLAKALYPYNHVPRKSYFAFSPFLQFFNPMQAQSPRVLAWFNADLSLLIIGGEILSVMITRLSHKVRCLHTRPLIVCSQTHRLCPNNSKQTWVRVANKRLPRCSDKADFIMRHIKKHVLC